MISYERKQAMIIKNGILVLPDLLVSGGIKLTNGVISEIGEPDGSDEVIDAGGNYISPGLIDIHVHGAEARISWTALTKPLEPPAISIFRAG